MKPDRPASAHLSLQDAPKPASVLCVGEVLWDLFDGDRRLGGAPLNFAAHVQRLGHSAALLSAVGNDELGRQAAEGIAALHLDKRFLQTTRRHPTGTAEVRRGPDGSPEFFLARPAAYDAIELCANDLSDLRNTAPEWLYYGTLFASTRNGRQVLDGLLTAFPQATRIYDVNLRPGSDSPDLVRDLLRHAQVVKVNEAEMARIQSFAGLPLERKAFCRAAVERYGWRAVSVTLGERGCAMLAGGEYVEAPGYPVEVTDTVGAGDAFGAAFLHGLSRNWPAAEIADFANRVGSWVANCAGAIPDSPPGWEMEELLKFA